MSISFVPLTIGEAQSSSGVDITTLTTVALNGSGIFDRLMSAVSLHIQDEFAKGRITGKDYATVYLGSMTAVLNAAVQYVVQGKEVEKLNAEIGLLRQKTVSELANTCNTLPTGLGFNNTTVIQGSSDRQNKLYEAQTDGFARDAEQKMTKIMVDTWAVRRTTDNDTIASASNGLADANIKTVLDKALLGIGITN